MMKALRLSESWIAPESSRGELDSVNSVDTCGTCSI